MVRLITTKNKGWYFQLMPARATLKKEARSLAKETKRECLPVPDLHQQITHSVPIGIRGKTRHELQAVQVHTKLCSPNNFKEFAAT